MVTAGILWIDDFIWFILLETGRLTNTFGRALMELRRKDFIIGHQLGLVEWGMPIVAKETYENRVIPTGLQWALLQVAIAGV